MTCRRRIEKASTKEAGPLAHRPSIPANPTKIYVWSTGQGFRLVGELRAWAQSEATSYSWGVGAAELWVESYQGEVLGEALFGLLAERQEDPEHRYQLEVLTLLERATKGLAEPVFEKRGLDRGDTASTTAIAKEMADALADTSWVDFLQSFEPITSEFLAKYRELVELSVDDTERDIAEQYVAHELALAAFARRALGQEGGEPLELILALPHVSDTGDL